MAGTCAEYDWQYGYCSEGVTPRNPCTPYSVCKNAAQEVLASFASSGGLSTAWGRVFFLYGPEESPLRFVASVISAIIGGTPALCSHGNQIRDYLHVEDVASAFVALLDSSVTGPVNIASGQPITIREIAETIASRLGGHELLKLGAIPVGANEPPFILADVRRLSQEVGWGPTFDLQRGLDQTIAWWLASSRLPGASGISAATNVR
jgi:nucleoside-diphosphate-sugar epimerase